MMSFVATVVALSAATTVGGAIYENSRKSMAAGDFTNDGRADAAYIKADGTILIYDFSNGQSQTLNLPSSETANRFVAADLNGDARAGLAVISNVKQLRTYDFATTAWTSDTAKSNLNELSSGNADGDARDEVFAVDGTAPSVYESGAWTGLGGGISVVTAGQFVADASVEFLGTTGSNLYYKPGTAADDFTTAWIQYGGGGSMTQVVGANLIVSDAQATDDVFLRIGSGTLYLCDHNAFTIVGTGADRLDAGRVDGDMAAGQDFAYVLGNDGTIYQSDRWDTLGPANRWVAVPVDAWNGAGSTGAATENTGVDDFLVADVDNDGLDEILALKSGELYLFNNGDSGFALVPEPSTFAITTLGLLGLLACARRRRR